MADFFIADLHIKHELVAELRGFSSVEDHDAEILFNIEEVLKTNHNRLWILGDISSGREEHELEALEKLNFAKWDTESELHLISGNHDSVSPLSRHAHRHHTRYREVFDSIDSIGTIRHNKAKVMLSHFPYGGGSGSDHTETERYPELRLRDVGKPLIHGHTHSTEKVSFSAQGTVQICVSADAWGFKPAKREHIVKLIDQNKDLTS